MKVGHLRVNRPDWYDRNPIVTGKSAGANGPIVSMTPWSYTVPTGKLAYLDSVFAMVRREVATATPGKCSVQVSLQDPGPTQITIPAYVQINGGAVDVADQCVIGAYGILTAGQILSCVGSDVSVGGQTILTANAKITEFVAAGVF